MLTKLLDDSMKLCPVRGRRIGKSMTTEFYRNSPIKIHQGKLTELAAEPLNELITNLKKASESIDTNSMTGTTNIIDVLRFSLQVQQARQEPMHEESQFIIQNLCRLAKKVVHGCSITLWVGVTSCFVGIFLFLLRDYNFSNLFTVKNS